MINGANPKLRTPTIRIIKLIGFNIAAFFCLMFLLNICAILAYKMYRVIDNVVDNTKARYKLPNYDNVHWAKDHFYNFGKLETNYYSYFGWRRKPYKSLSINIDENGIRHTPQHPRATKKSPLIVFLGGSTMWGTGSNDASTIPAFFAQFSEGKYRVLNLGESSYKAFQSYLFLKIEMIKGLKPDIIITYDGVNDSGFLGHDFKHAYQDAINTQMQGVDRGQLLTFRSFFFRSIVIGISKIKHKFTDYKEATYDRGTYDLTPGEELLESWLAMKDLADKNGIPFIAILQPMLWVGSPERSHLYPKITKDLKHKEAKAAHFYDSVLELLKTSTYQELSKHVLVYKNIYDTPDRIYIDGCHVSPKGSEITAKKIHTYIYNNYN